MTLSEIYELKYNIYMMIHDSGNESFYLSELKEILGEWTPWQEVISVILSDAKD